MKKVFAIFFLVLALFWVSGCSPTFHRELKAKLVEPSVQEELLLKGREFVKEKKFSDAVQVYRAVIAENAKDPSAAEAQYQLGYVYVSADNPNRDYNLALREFSRLMAQYPESDRLKESASWVLLITEYQRLNQRLEDLTNIDIELEKKRRQIK